MNIVYLIGNGFDVAQGLKTSYPDFYDSYKHSVPVNKVEQKIIDSIDEGTALWSDLEWALGMFTESIDDEDAFTEAYVSLSNKLKEYLRGQEDAYVPDSIRQFQKDIANPFEDLTYGEKRSFYDFVSSFGDFANVNVISFNYTNVLERAIGFQNRELPLEGPFFSKGIQLNGVYKVHGVLSGTIMMGVNDVGQIANQSFSKNPDICDFLVKPQMNSVIGVGFDFVCSDLIASADLIIVFGMSIGETDRIWWTQVAERMKSPNVKMIVFQYRDKPVPEDRAFQVGKLKREVKRHFADVAGVSEEFREVISSRLFVSFRGYMFNPRVARFDPIVQSGH